MLQSKWDRYKLPPRPNRADAGMREGLSGLARGLGTAGQFALPVLGGALGAVVGGAAAGPAGVLPGLGAGGGIGMAAGSGLAGLGNMGADYLSAPEEEDDLDRQARLQALFMLGGRR